MIQLTVLSYNGQPANGPAASFDELGGTIGRADNNQLVLPDPERTISRVHARVVFRGGGYSIVDNGSNPISVNGKPLGSGREHPLNPGDEVQIGGYVLQAQGGAPAAAAAADDPFADLFGGSGLAAPTIPPQPVGGAWPPPAPPASGWPPVPAPAPALSPGQIPEDWDPFAPDPSPATIPPRPLGAAPAPGNNDLMLDLPLGGGGSSSLDDLFGLGPAAPVADPLGGAPSQPLLLQPNTAGDEDPFASLSRPPAPVAPATLPTRGSELNTPMPLPASAAPHTPTGAVFSWDQPARESREARVAAAPVAAAAPARPLAAPVAAPAPRAAAAPSAGDDALLAALLQGLAVPGLRIESLTPELMQRLGVLVRESTRGAVELLVARAALKREMRAEVTMIVARENNPLKFSPSVEVALQHLLGPAMPGFMAAEPAVRDAFDDLRAHQLGVMAGMKAALDGVLQRFDPQQLEGKLTKKSAINSLIPATRKARLWELFNELFGQLQSEAQDDFDELFGRAFLKAYQAQLDRLQDERQAP